MSPAKKTPTKADLLTIIGLAHEAIAAIATPAALNIPALKQFYDLSKHYGLSPTPETQETDR
jgi:hypothetical protein